MSQQIDILTVCFGVELAFLKMQAFSVNKCVPNELIGNIVIVVNEPTLAAENKTVERIEREAIPYYGKVRRKVKIEKGSSLGTLSDKGWKTQQAWKLAGARFCTRQHYLILDTKNHFIRPITYSSLFDDNGVPIRHFAKIRRDQRPWLDASCEVMGIENTLRGRRYPSSTPPFVMHTQSTIDLVNYLEELCGKDISSFFLDKDDVSTEFTLYIAYLLKINQFDKQMKNTVPTYTSLRARVDERRLGYVKDKIASDDVWLFSVHRRFLSKTLDDVINIIADAWTKYLYSNREDAYKAIKDMSHELDESLSGFVDERLSDT